VDPVSHAALGRTLIAFDARHRLGRGAAAACILGALSPDLDLARAARGWDVYLRAHQGGTHSIAGAIGCGLLTASLVRAAVRGARWRSLALAATAGALSHVALDLLAGADIRPLWPASGRLVTLPLFAMADPWLLAAFVIALALLWPSRRPRAAAGVLLTVIAMSAVKGALFVRALGADARATPGAAVRRADAVFGSWREWTFFHANGDVADRWEVDGWNGAARRVLAVPRGLASPAARSSVALSSVENLRASHAVTIARTRPTAGGRYEVLWTDLRYCGAGLAASEPVCGLWFGGEYEAGGPPIDVVVHVGTLTQRRPVRRTPADDQ
jgi:membrane-bound metal-dependent hydrolase YbcI (DUF457 family)